MLSHHDPSTVYLGGDRLFKSTTRGDTWTASPDLTKNIGRNDRPIMGVAGTAPMASKHDGAASYSNIVTIGESPLVPGIVWVGTNDGNVQVSRDGAATWTNVVGNIKGVPAETHVSRVEPSDFDAGTCYVSFDGHRTDDHKPYVFVTRDFGQTWTSIAANLPEGNVNVIKEDPKNRNLLYLGTEYAFYISLTGGKDWKRFMTGLPTVRIDDILVHPRDNDLIVGTHGRSIWIIDDITPLQQMTDAVTTADAHLFERAAGDGVGERHHEGERARRATSTSAAQNPQGGTAISYYLKAAASRRREDHDQRHGGPRGPRDGRHEGRGTQSRPVEPRPEPVLALPATLSAAVAAAGAGAAAAACRSRRRTRSHPGTYVVKLAVGGKELMTTVQVEADESGTPRRQVLYFNIGSRPEFEIRSDPKQV